MSKMVKINRVDNSSAVWTPYSYNETVIDQSACYYAYTIIIKTRHFILDQSSKTINISKYGQLIYIHECYARANKLSDNYFFMKDN